MPPPRRRVRLIRNHPDSRTVTFQFNQASPPPPGTIENLDPLDCDTMSQPLLTKMDAALALTNPTLDPQVVAIAVDASNGGLPDIKAQNLFEVQVIPGESYSGSWTSYGKVESDFTSGQLADLNALSAFA